MTNMMTMTMLESRTGDDDDKYMPQSTSVHVRAGQHEVLAVEGIVLHGVEPDLARVRPEARQRRLRKHNAHDQYNANVYEECNDNSDDGDDPHRQGC